MNLQRLFNVINNSVFTINGKLDYFRVTEAVILLANEVHKYEGETEDIWTIGEGGECTLDEFIVGAYWHYTECHDGQYSKGYEALSALGQVFKPNMASVEQDNTAYRTLNDMSKGEYQGQ